MNNLLAGAVAPYNSDIKNPVFKGSLQNFFDAPDATVFLDEFLPRIIGLLLVAGSLFFFFMLIWGSIQWILSGGDKAAIESARGRISAAFIGIVILLSSFALIKVVEAFFGIDILTIDIGPLIIK